MSAHFQKLAIEAVGQERDDAISLRFKLTDGIQDAFAFRSGQHVTLRAKIVGQDVRRNYSICTSATATMQNVTVWRRPLLVRAFLICGPSAMMDAAEVALRARHRKRSHPNRTVYR